MSLSSLKESERRSRFVRMPGLSPMVMQDRDTEILKTLYHYCFLTTT